MSGADRLTRRGRAAAASATPRGVLRRNDAGELVPLDPPTATGTAAADAAPAADTGTAAEARQVRQIDGQGWAR